MNTIKKIVKQSTCRERAVFLLTDLFLAALCALGMQVSFNGDVWGTPEENFLRPLTLLTLGRFVLFLLLEGPCSWHCCISTAFTAGGRQKKGQCGRQEQEKTVKNMKKYGQL